MFLVASVVLWHNFPNLFPMLVHLCVSFKSHLEWNNAPMITTGTYHGLNCFSHMMCALQTRTYQNIAKILTCICIIVWNPLKGFYLWVIGFSFFAVDMKNYKSTLFKVTYRFYLLKCLFISLETGWFFIYIIDCSNYLLS